MIRSHALLRCPEDRSELKPAGTDTIEQLNAAIRAGRVKNRGGRMLDVTIEQGLIRSANDLLYPVARGIPLLLRDEGILLNQIPQLGNKP